MGRVWLRLCFVWALVAALLFVRTAAAAEPIPSITIDQHGPNRAIPTSDSFYIEGPAADAEQVLVVFVRESWKPWGIGRRKPIDCETAYADQIGVIRKELEGGGSMPSADQLAERFDKQILVGHWNRASADEKKFEVLFDANSFFRPGSRYCAVIVEVQRTTTLVSDAADIETYRNTIYSCEQGDEACERDAKQSLCRALFDIEAPAKEPCDEADTEAKRDLLDTIATGAVTVREQTRYMKEEWPEVYDEQQQPDAALAKLAPTTPLGGLLAELAVRNDIDVAIVRNPAVPHEYLTTDNAKLTAVQVMEKASGEFSVALWVTDDKGKESVRAKIPASVLVFPSHTTSPLRLRLSDLLDVWTNKRIVDGHSLSMVDAAIADPAGTEAMLDAYRAALTIGESDFCAKANGQRLNPTNPYCQLADVVEQASWLSEDKKDGRLAAHARRIRGASNALGAIVQVNESWDAIAKRTESSKVVITVSGYSVQATTADLSQSAFFDQYITPVAGISLDCMGNCAGGPLASAHLGVQIYLYPNSYNEPMWINRAADLSRLLALEIGLIPKVSNIGGDRQVTGIGGRFPPMTFGVAVQLIPYVTATVGTIVYGERVSGLGPELYRTRAGLHFAINVQANLPGIIRGFFSGNKAI